MTTLSIRRTSRRALAKSAERYPDTGAERPQTREDCSQGERPCPWVGCKYHLYLDVNAATGSIKLNFPHLEPDELLETCALDVAEQGGVSLHSVGQLLNITRERVRQIEGDIFAELGPDMEPYR